MYFLSIVSRNSMKLKLGIILFILSGLLNAQNKKLIKADLAYNLGEYFKAIELYDKAYDKSEDKAEKAMITFQIAQCYRFVNNSKKAETYYKRAISKDYPYPEAILLFADMLKKNRKYDLAVEQYEKYTEIMPGDERGINGAKSCELAQVWIDNPTRYEIEDFKDINSRQADFSPCYGKDDYRVIFFTSSRDGTTGGKFNYVSGQNFTDLFMSSKNKKAEWSKPEPIMEPVNTEHDEGACAMNAKFGTMYFTSCRVVDKEKIGCQIYTTSKSGETWAEPSLVALGPDSISFKHPSISKDEFTLYFVAEMRGGEGRNDIWRVKRTKIGGQWGVPENLGPEINTPGNEVFPYIHENGTLYFSSDYHVGMGGLDIFKARQDEEGKWTIENMKCPVNSYEDDFGIVFQKSESTEENGLFTSTRKGRGNDDIYTFYLPPLEFYLNGTVKDKETEAVLTGAAVKLIGSDGTSIQIESDAEGFFKYKLKHNTDYVFLVKKEGYLNGKGKVTTMNIFENKDYMPEILMTPIAKPIEVQNIFYDLDSWELRIESLNALDSLVETLNFNPGIIIELGSHTDFRGTAEYNEELSQKRAQSVVDYLIEGGISADRLTARGYGATVPQEISKNMAKRCSFNEGDVLTEEFINNLATEELKEEAHQINRRTEFRVLSDKYVPEKE